MQKAKRPRRSAFRDNYLAAFGAVALLLCSLFGQAQVLQRNTQYGVSFLRVDPDSVLYLPTGCGIPTDSTYLFSKGFGNGERRRKAAIYYDSCGHHSYLWDPSTKTWHVGDGGGGSGGGGSSGFSLRNLSSSNFSTPTNCPLPSLNGDTLQIFWNDLNRFLVQGVDWIPLSGGGFTIIISGFDATAANYLFTLYSNTGSLSPGPARVQSTAFSTATNCPLPAYNGMQLQIFWNDLNRYLVPGTEWTPLSGGGFTMTIPGFDASASSYSFYIFNQ